MGETSTVCWLLYSCTAGRCIASQALSYALPAVHRPLSLSSVSYHRGAGHQPHSDIARQRLPVDGTTYGDATSSTSTSSSSSAPAIAVVSIAAADPGGGGRCPTGPNTPPAVDLSASGWTTPRRSSQRGRGSPHMSVIRSDPFTDPGATVYDNIDGNSVPLVRQVQLCTRPSGIQTALANDSRPLTCVSQAGSGKCHQKPSGKGEVFVNLHILCPGPGQRIQSGATQALC